MTDKHIKKPAVRRVNGEFGPFTIVQIDAACSERFKQDFIERNGKPPAIETAYHSLAEGVKARMRLEMLRVLKAAQQAALPLGKRGR